jgi:ABC-type maltose transport system permease subunit
VEFCAVVVLPLIVILFPPRYTDAAGIAAMIALYGLALALDHFDRRVAAIIVTGGHPWKHLAAALAIFCYVSTVAHRHPRP